MAIVRLASLVSILVFAGMFWAEGFWPIALVMTAYSFFWNASLPQFEVVTFSYLKEQAARYARIRVWGSIGFIVTVVVLGAIVERYGAESVLPAVLAIFVAISPRPASFPHTPVRTSAVLFDPGQRFRSRARRTPSRRRQTRRCTRRP